MLLDTTTGFLTGLTLIIAIGAQNAFVLRQGLLRSHVGTVVAICAVSDLALIVAGVAGIGTIVEQAPAAITVVRWLGVAFLGWYGVSSLLRARDPDPLRASATGAGGLRRAAITAMALTWLNPHVYLDTVLLLGCDRQPGRRGGSLVVRDGCERGEPRVVRRPRLRRPPCQRACSRAPAPGRCSTC